MDARAELLDVALTLFANYGYDAVGVQAIVEAANVTKPTLYHHFGSKRGLFEALVHEKSRRLSEAVQAASDYKGDITTSINNVVRAYFNYATKQPVFYRMLLATWFAPPSSEYSPVIHELLERHIHLLERMFELATNDHGNMRGRHRQYAVSLKGIIDTYIGLSLQDYVDLSNDEFQRRIVHQFMHGIFS